MHTVSYRDDELARHYGLVLEPQAGYRHLLSGPGLTARCAFTGRVIRTDSAGWVRDQIRIHEFPVLVDRTGNYEQVTWLALFALQKNKPIPR